MHGSEFRTRWPNGGRSRRQLEEIWSRSTGRQLADASLEEDQVLFNPEGAQRLFAEVDVVFPKQLKKDYEQLIAFNRAITDERRQYLQAHSDDADTQENWVTPPIRAGTTTLYVQISASPGYTTAHKAYAAAIWVQ